MSGQATSKTAIYTGTFVNENFEGENCTLVNLDDSGRKVVKYQGSFKDGEYHGHGHLVDERKFTYTGGFL